MDIHVLIKKATEISREIVQKEAPIADARA